MPKNLRFMTDCAVTENELVFTLDDLCRSCDASAEQIVAWVEEGVLLPMGQAPATDPQDWRFGGGSLTRALIAIRLARELDLEQSSTALVLELLLQIASLKACLKLSAWG